MNDYPDSVSVDGVEYQINTGFRDALACLEAINDADMSEVERAWAVIGILYKQEPEDLQEALRMAVKYLQCGREEKARYREPDMDFEYDMPYIKSSFMSDYRIDLDFAEIHWWKFCNLLQGLTDDCVLNRVRDIRNYDLSTVQDDTLRQKIIDAKEDFALPQRMAPEEQRIIDEFESLFD